MELLGVEAGVWDVGLVAIVGLAAFRLWGLLAKDTILSSVRARLPSRFVDFLSCPWCAGFWVAAATFATVEVWGDGVWVQTGVVVLALSAVVGLAGSTSKDDV